jgi:hypothetical protein
MRIEMVLPERETEKREGSAGRKKYCPFTCTSLCFGSLMMEEPTLPIISLFSVGGVPASVWVCVCVWGVWWVREGKMRQLQGKV